MKESNSMDLPSDKSPPSDADEFTEVNMDCLVNENSFPCMEKCCNKSDTETDKAITAICPYCSVWTSFPDSESLEVIAFLDCRLKGFAKRIKI